MPENLEKEIKEKLDQILAFLKVGANTKYLTAREVEKEYGVKSKTLLNRSNLPVMSKRHIPSVRLNGGRKKHFERKVLERIFQLQGEVVQ